MLTQEKINFNFVNFTSKLEKYGAYPDKMKEDVEFNEALRTASAFTSEDTGGAYEGSLIEHVTRIAVIAFNVNKLLMDEVTVPVDSLIKVCYLHQLAKVLMIKKTTAEWEIKKNKLFTFAKNLPALKTAEYSLFICAKYGIELTEEEYEAISSTEKEGDLQVKYFSNSIGQILRTSIELANTERRLRHKFYLKG